MYTVCDTITEIKFKLVHVYIFNYQIPANACTTHPHSLI